MLVCLFHGSTHMARLGASFLAFFTLSLLRPTCGRSFMSTGASRVDKDLRKNHLASAGRSEDVFIFADGRSLDDSDCPPNCLKCSTNGECLHCANSKYLNPSKWTCEDMCPDGYYPEGTGTSNRTCTQCASDCAICLSPAKCVQCQSKYLSPAGVCGSSCPSGYYAHTEGTCRSCPTRCVSCSDWHHCDTCVPGAYLTPNRTCVVDCDDGYYKDDTGASEKETGGVCTQCQETCSKCISHDVCTECRKKTYLSPTDNMCRSTCGDGFYQRGADEIGNTCHECPDSCRICTSSSACSSCSEGYFLTPDSACDTECPDGFYANSTLRSCQPCPAGCGKCTAGLVSPVVCLECIDYNLLSHRGECTRTCPEGYYPQAGNGHLGGVCVICDPSCIACQSREECTKCNMLLYLTPEAKCEMECPRGWTWRGGLDLKEPGVCMPCGDNCAACQTLEVCDVCKNRRYLHQGRCVKSCPARFYGLTAPSQGEEGRLCRNCRVNDYECFSPNAIVGKDPDPMLTVIAKSCQNDYYLYGGACHPKALCPVGTYPRRGEETPSWPGNFIGGICEDCPHNCLSCSSPLRCTTCRRNTYLTLDMSCQENCPVGFFGVGTAETGRTCQPCSANCSACQSQAFCTKCTNGTFLTADFSCEAQCPEGFYSRSPADGSLDGRACEKCLGDCLTCETRFYCTKCKNAAYLTHRKECMPARPPTHYPDGSDDREGRFCIECPGTCSECLGPQNCTECKTPTFLTARGTCDSSCQEGQYMEEGRYMHHYWGVKVGGACKPCSESCNRCLGSGCTECNKFTYLDPNGECVEQCPDGFFGVGIEEPGRVCAACPPASVKCLNKTFVLECGEGTYLDPWNTSCVQTCPDGYFGLDGEMKAGESKIGGVCKICPGTCKLCSATACEVCKDGTFLNPLTGRCSLQCPTDHYMSGHGDEGRVCKSCPEFASSCVNETWIFQCRGNNQYLVPGGGSCATECPDGYYRQPGVQLEVGGPLIGGTCEKCVGSCSVCKSATECLKCQGGTFLDPISSECSFTCPTDHFMTGAGDKGRLCKACPDNFALCKNASFALQCRGDQQYLVPAGGRCSASCIDGYYPHSGVALDENGPLVGGTCERCVAPCETCLSATECKTCKGGAYLNPFDSSCRFACPAGTYMTGTGDIGRKCEACPPQMYSCINATYASLCRGNNYYLTPLHTCEMECPDGYFKLGGSSEYDGGPMIGGSCQRCINNCKECFSADQCMSCRNGAYFNPRDQQCEFSCPEDHYMVGKGEEGRECVPCPDQFHSCLNATWGTHCRGDNKYLADNGTCVSTCPDGYFRRHSKVTGVDGVLIGGTCAKCIGDCRECLNEQKCLVCENEKFLNNGTCLSSCPNGFFAKQGKDGINGTCELCTQGSATCELGQDNMARPLTCEAGFLLQDSECVSTCPAGKYTDPHTETCIGCPAACGACINQQKCTICKNDAVLDVSELPNKSMCVHSCPDGYYSQNGLCHLCSQSCGKCSSLKSCAECKDYTYLTINGAGFTCESDCPDGYYPSGVNAIGRTCRPCSDGCLKCATAGECKQCGGQKYRVPDGWCEDGCPSGYYRHGDGETGRTCQVCPGDFFNCIDATIGTECRNQKYLTASGTCENGCPVGTYPHGVGDLGRTCMPCGQNCAACSDGETCDQCTNSHYLTADHWCEDACPDGYYKNGTGKLGRRCLTCPAGISKCISPTVATECRDAKYLTTHGACVDACPDGTYPTGHSSIGRTCQVCEASCAQCTQANICLQCKNGWYLTADLWCEEGCPDGYFRKGTDNALGRSCAPCPENALKCIGPALITECRNWLYLTPDGTCAPGCPQGTYPSGLNAVGRRCESCHSDCMTCTRENQCTQCRNGKYLTPSSWCEASCPHGTYKNGTGAIGNTCDPCPGDYSACIHPTYATECKHAKFLTPDAACRDTCPQGYFQEGLGELGRHCPRCHENCKSCSAPALCTVCDNGKFLSPNMWCDDTCPDGYYRNGSGKIGNTCPACPKHASKCLNASHSIECKDSRYLTPDFTCEVDCPRGLFQKGATTTGRVCSQCPSNCTLCVNGTACRECRNNLYLTPKFLCEAECPSDHYYEPASSLKQIDWKKLPDHSCGGNELWQWSGGGDSKYGEQFVDNLVGCQLMCMARAECAAFEMRDDSNSCSFWKAEPLAPKATKGIHCFQKVGLVPKKAKATTGEVVLPAAGIASMSSSLESTLPRLCNDGLVATRCSSTWNEAAGEQHPWWQLDLGANETVVKVRVLNQPENCEALSEELTGLHCSLLGGVVGVSKRPCEKGKLCNGTVCGTLTQPGADKWYEVSCDRSEGRYVYLQLQGYRVLNFHELVAYKVSTSESCVETWQMTNIVQKGDTFIAANQNGGDAFAVAGPVSSLAFKPGQDDRSVWVGLTTDPTDEKDFENGRFVLLTAHGSILIDGAKSEMTYTTEDYLRLELKGSDLIISKNGAPIHIYDLGSSTSLHGWYAMIWFEEMGPNDAVYLENIQTTCFPLPDGVGGTCMKCPEDVSRCVNTSIALECKNDMYLRRTHDCAPQCPIGDFPTDGANGIGGYCTQCSENCKTCANASICLECKNQRYLTIDFQCSAECTKGYYEIKGDAWDNGLGGWCKSCHENCSACNSWEECTECTLYNFRTPDATCTDSCPDTYYKNGTEKTGGECLPCADNCFECVSATTCVNCNNSHFLSQSGECVEHCPDGEYEVGEEEFGRECKKCPNDFNKCLTATYASECTNNLYLTAEAQCEPFCPDGFYRAPLHGKLIGRECPRCPEDCNKCQDAGACSECKNSMYLSPDLWCEPECPTGYYKVGNGEIGNMCQKCPVSCRACVDAETCTECMDFKYLSPSRQCVETCPENTFPQGDDEAGRVCAYCEKNCHTCSTATRCLECNNSLHLDEMFNCVDACPSGYYPEGSKDRGRSCLSCPTYCSICAGPEVCLECHAFRYLNPDSTCRADCPDGFYKQGYNETRNTCPRCFHTCSKCDSADVCTECKNFTYLTPDSKCNYECPAGYWERGTEEVGGSCERCSDNCAECSSMDVCEVCHSGYFLDITSGTCKKECPDGYWEKILDRTVDIGRTCELCSWPCNKCDSDQHCTECKDSSYLTPFDTCEYTCPPGFYPQGVGEIGVTCQLCSGNCATCDTYEVCTTCKNNKFLNPDGTCQDICPDGYWQLPVSGGVGNSCPLCAENCSLCTSPTVCQECRNSTYLTHYSWCEVQCQDGYYEEGAGHFGRVCKACPGTCNKCKAENYCTECKKSTYLTSLNACEQSCPIGFYPNRDREVGGECETCPEQCSQCTSASTCSECKDGLYLTPYGFCEDTCPLGHFARDGTAGVGGTCPMCPENCYACNNAEECTVCNNNTHLTAYGQCRSECPAGYYENVTSGIDGDVHRVCLQCPGHCNTCENGLRCTECKNSLYLTAEQQCESDCGHGFFHEGFGVVGRTCQPCMEDCHKCQTSTECLECKNDKYLTPTQDCADVCPLSYYGEGDQAIGRTCEPCSKDCNRCDNREFCTECKNSVYLTSVHQCESECGRGYFHDGFGDIGRTCQPCRGDCNECLSSTECLVCKNSKYLTPTQDCSDVCPLSYYGQGELIIGRTCEPCSKDCNRCEGIELCTECKNSVYLTSAHQCERECGNGFFHDGFGEVGRTCQQCRGDCNECLSATECLECKNSKYLTPVQDCSDACPQGYYGQGEQIIGKTCEKCSKDCARCEGVEFCAQCTNSTFLTENKYCTGECATGFIETGDTTSGRLCKELCFWC